MNDPTTLNRLYGRSKGKRLREEQAALVEMLLPQISIPDEGVVSSNSLFGNARPLHFEIGFGGGEHMAYRADMLPDHGFIGCEPYLNGVAMLLPQIRDENLHNIRVHMGDALDVLRRIPDGSLSFVYLLHPDPWPKARHIKRRMMNDGPVQMIAAKLKPGGEFRFGTDHPVYLRHAMMVMQRHLNGPDAPFEWLCKGPEDFLIRPGGWPETRYERKAREIFGHEVWYFRYKRL